MNKYFWLILMPLFYNLSFSQLKDTIFSNVKSVKEEVKFLNKDKQNYKLLEFDGDYGHSGFISNYYTKDRFYDNWYQSSFVHYLNYYKEFNDTGKPVKEIWFYKDGSIVRQYEYRYNDKNQLIQIKEIRNDSSNNIINKSYNFKGKLKSEVSYYSDEPENFWYSFYNYNDNLKIVESSRFSFEGAVSNSKIFYDNKGRKIKKVYKDYWVTEYYNDDSSSTGLRDYGYDKLKEEYFYDEKSNLIEIKNYKDKYKSETEVELSSKTSFFYNEENLIRFKTQSDKNDTLRSFVEYKYDRKRRKTEELYISERFIEKDDDIIFNKKALNIKGIKLTKKQLIVDRLLKYKYDHNDNLKQLLETDTFGKTRTTICNFEYVFDDRKNWVEQIKYINGEKLYIWKREINYF